MAVTGWGSKQKIVSYQTTKEENVFMSYKIVRVINGVASIASSDGTFFDFPVSKLDFDPQKGDVVQCFKNDERIIIAKQIEGRSIQIVKGSMTDPRDGKVYGTVEIGTHIWLAENLNYKTSDSLCYDNDEENAQKYGRLYKFSDAKNACPSGWHLPSNNEIESLVHAVGGMSNAGKSLKSVSGWQNEKGQSKNSLDSVGFSALPAGFWGAEDDAEGSFCGVGEVSHLWFDSGFMSLYHHSDYVDIEPFDDDYANDFYSVRCVKDEAYYKIIRVINGVASVVSNCGDIFNISVKELDFDPKTGDEVLCFKNGEQVLVVSKDFASTKMGKNDQTQDNPKDVFKIIRVLKGVASVASSSGDVLNVPVDELDFEPKAGDDVQCFRNGEKVIVLKNSSVPRSEKTASKIESNVIEQKTPIENPFADDAVEKKSSEPWAIGIIILLLGILFACIYLNRNNGGDSKEIMTDSHEEKTYKAIVKGTMTDSRDGRTYKTVTIGNQTWMAENLNYKTKKGSWCYNDNESNCTRYGRLYIWSAAMDSAGTWSMNGKGCGYRKTCSVASSGSATLVQGVCPEGWHLPSSSEFNTLDRDKDTGWALKSTRGWDNGGNGNDAFGFSALPAGVRTAMGGYFNEGEFANFWGSTEGGSDIAFSMRLVNVYDFVRRDFVDKNVGISVRCIQN